MSFVRSNNQVWDIKGLHHHVANTKGFKHLSLSEQLSFLLPFIFRGISLCFGWVVKLWRTRLSPAAAELTKGFCWVLSIRFLCRSEINSSSVKPILDLAWNSSCVYLVEKLFHPSLSIKVISQGLHWRKINKFWGLSDKNRNKLASRCT